MAPPKCDDRADQSAVRKRVMVQRDPKTIMYKTKRAVAYPLSRVVKLIANELNEVVKMYPNYRIAESRVRVSPSSTATSLSLRFVDQRPKYATISSSAFSTSVRAKGLSFNPSLNEP